MRALVTGATGRLGRPLCKQLTQRGVEVRGTSRRAQGDLVELDLAAGRGIEAAVAGVDVILHCASSPFRRTRRIDVGGTGRLLEAAKSAGVSHFVYPSIVGIDRIPMAYYRAKLDAEQVIANGPIPWSTVRATQFHEFVVEIIDKLTVGPVAFLPNGVVVQPVHTEAFASRLAEVATAGPTRRVENLAGPDKLDVREMARMLWKARSTSIATLPVPVFGKAAAALRSGALCSSEHEVPPSFADWLSGAR